MHHGICVVKLYYPTKENSTAYAQTTKKADTIGTIIIMSSII